MNNSHDKFKFNTPEDKNRFQRQMLLVTYAIILFLALANIDHVASGVLFVLDILAPVFWGIAIAYILNLLLVVFERRLFGRVWNDTLRQRRGKRRLSVLLTCVAFAAIIVVLTIFIVPQLWDSVSALVTAMPDYFDQFQAFLQTNLTKVPGGNDFLAMIDSSWNDLMQRLNDYIPQLLNQGAQFLITVGGGVVNIFLGLIIAIYFLLSKEKLARIGRKLTCALMPQERADFVMKTASEASATFSNFLRGQIIEACILGLICFGCMKVMGMPYAVLISTIIGVTALIPIVGAFLGAIPGVLILLAGDPWQALAFIIMIIIIQQVEGNLIYPKVVGTAIGMSGLWVFLSVIIGGSLFGVFGIIIFVPLVAVLYAILRAWTNKRLKERHIKIE